MIVALSVVSIVASALMAAAIGRAFIVDRESFLRSKVGVWMLVIGGMSLLFLPPQVAAMASVKLPQEAQVPGVGELFVVPAGYSPEVVNAIWIVTTIAAFLIGLQVWRAGRPDWRAGSGVSLLDSSPAGRARGLLVMSDTLDDVADVLVRVKLDAKGAEQLAPALRDVGRRLALKLPVDSTALYKLVVDLGVPIPVAGPVTRYLHEGAATQR